MGGRLLVPRVIHRLWIGGAEPEWTQPFAESWLHPGWELRRWSDANVGELFPLRNQAIYDAAAEIAPDHVGQLRSDVLRYEILHRFGGIWVDADMECLRPLDELLEGISCFAAWEVEGRWVNNAILGSTAGHPFLEGLISGLAASVERNRGRKPNRISGPQYLTRLWRRGSHGLMVFPQECFYPYGFDEIAEHGLGEDWPGAYAVHHWANRRREKEVPA